MMSYGKSFVSFVYKGGEILFRNDAPHYLCVKPKNWCYLDVIKEINLLLANCRKEILEEVDKWNAIRLQRDDNEGDLIR
jgi:hypothetical protein